MGAGTELKTGHQPSSEGEIWIRQPVVPADPSSRAVGGSRKKGVEIWFRGRGAELSRLAWSHDSSRRFGSGQDPPLTGGILFLLAWERAIKLFIYLFGILHPRAGVSELQSSRILLIVLISVVSTHTLDPVCTFPSGLQCNLTWNVHGFQQRLVLRG